MSNSDTGMTSVDHTSPLPNQMFHYHHPQWFYLAAFQKGIKEAITTTLNQIKKSEEETKKEIAELYKSLGLPAPNLSGGGGV